jgi:hypothetical protein
MYNNQFINRTWERLNNMIKQRFPSNQYQWFWNIISQRPQPRPFPCR